MFFAAMRHQSLASSLDMDFEWSPPSNDELASRLHNNQTDEFVDQATLLLTADWNPRIVANTGVMIWCNGHVVPRRPMIRAW